MSRVALADTTPHPVFLNPGEWYFGGGHTRISTLLGSCVSITLWHPRLHLGGMCHIQVPERRRTPETPRDARFADEALELLEDAVLEHQTHLSDYEVKLFGGGAMFDATTQLDVGQRNLDKVHTLLAARRLVPIAEHIGGQGRRKLHFELWNGHVWLAFPEGRNAKTQIRRDAQNG